MKKSIKKSSVEGRKGSIKRVTNETNISVSVGVNGTGKGAIKTGVPFLDHMLTLFARHGAFDLTVKAKGDIDVDIHHTNEDVAITLGQAFRKALDKKKGIVRYGFFYVPMDEALVRVVLDISDRPCVELEGFPKSRKVYDTYAYPDCVHFLRSFSQSLGLNLHVSILAGTDMHHIIEAVFKALARSLDIATTTDARSAKRVPSTKGVL